MLRLIVRFLLGVLFGFTFLISFQIFRLNNWFIGGMMVMLLFGALFALLGASMTQPVARPAREIDRSSLAVALTKIFNEARVDASGRIEIDSSAVYAVLEKHYIGQPKEIEES